MEQWLRVDIQGDGRGHYGETVLVRAAGSGNVQVIRALLAAGADPSQPGELLHLPHEEAEHRGFADAADLLRAPLHAKRR